MAVQGGIIGRCACHKWHSITAIGEWIVHRAGRITVREWASRPIIWQPGQSELSREDLTAAIHAAGGIRCGYALHAMTRLWGDVELTNGVHRWAIAAELGIEAVPVQMIFETEPVWTCLEYL